MKRLIPIAREGWAVIGVVAGVLGPVAVLGAARQHGIRWLYAVHRPVLRAPVRAANGFAGVESVLELAQGLAARSKG